jgi:hypothetical protein
VEADILPTLQFVYLMLHSMMILKVERLMHLQKGPSDICMLRLLEQERRTSRKVATASTGEFPAKKAEILPKTVNIAFAMSWKKP